MESSGEFYRHFPFFNKIYDSAKTSLNNVMDYIHETVEKQKAELEFKEIEEPENYVEAYIKEQRILEKTGITDHKFR